MSNHADKRSVSTDALETLGTIIGPNEKRDAIHLAVDPAVAVEVLQPGEDVGFVAGGVGRCSNPVGIVDPFLKAPVQPGERFWLVVYPRQIKSLRHVWTHPAFDDEPAQAETISDTDRKEFMKELDGTNASKRWIQAYAKKVGLSYEDLMEGTDEWIRTKEYMNRGELLEGESVPFAFWRHYEIVTGTPVEDECKESFFTCSC